jgi:hypothetical protein
MTAHHTPRSRAEINLNHLRRGATYRATTSVGIATGEYLGMEALYGSRAVLLRHAAGTDSIDRRDIMSIEAVAA